MSQDLFLGIVKKNWARGALDANPLPPLHPVVATPARLSPPMTAAERARVGKIYSIRSRAESGDPAARKEWRKISTAVVGLRVRARGGDPRAVRACQVLEETRLFSQKSSLSGAATHQPPPQLPVDDGSGSETEHLLGEFVGDEARTAREAGGAEQEADARVRGEYAVLGQWNWRGRRRRRHLRHLVERSVRGDANAAAKLQQVTARLTQRSQAGDQGATSLLQQVQSWTTTYQARLAANPSLATNYPTTYPPTYPPTYNPTPTPGTVGPGSPAPYVPPAASPFGQTFANVTYPAPGSQDYYDDSGTYKGNTGEVDDF